MPLTAPTAPGIQGAPPIKAQPNNGSTATPPQPTTPPATTSTFKGPPTGTITSPAVITAKPAVDHLAEMKTALEGAQADLQNMRTYKAQSAAAQTPAPTDTTKTPAADTTGGSSTTPTPDNSALDTEINSILDGLSTDGSSDTTPTDTANDSEQTTVANDTDAIAVDQQTQDQVNSTLDSITSGTYPLSPAEQSQVTAIKSQYSSAIDAANKYAKAVALGATARVAADGIQEYSPAEAIGEIHAAVNAGAQKIDALNAKVLDSQLKLSSSLTNNDYKAASRLYTQISNDIKARTDEISKINTTLATQTTKLQTNALNAAKLQINSLLASDKLDMTQKQNVVTNALKSGTLDEKTRHDIQTEVTAQLKAQKNPSVTKPPADTVTNTETWLNGTRGADDYVDPNAYKQAFDSWISSGYQAKDFVKNYPPKQFVNPANDWLPKYLESKTSTTKAAPADLSSAINAAFPSGSELP